MKNNISKNKISAIDLFCGIGGLAYGLENAGIKVLLGVDINKACKYPFESNTQGKFLEFDVCHLNAKILKETWKDSRFRILAGCAPCQPFSKYNQGRSNQDDPRWLLLDSFSNLITKTQPEIVTMENVEKLGRHQIFQKFLKKLEKFDYKVVWGVLDCRHFSIPQARRRLVLIASKLGTPFLPEPTTPKEPQWITVAQAIKNLPTIKAGESCTSDPIHITRSLSKINLERIKASKPGGTWRDWPSNLVNNCHKKKTGKTYPSVYGRMEWDKPGPTITGQCYGYGNGRFGHPSQNRAISLREAAILQSFPAEYKFIPNTRELSMTSIGMMIGNAVPPKLAEAIGKAIIKHIKNFERL